MCIEAFFFTTDPIPKITFQELLDHIFSCTNKQKTLLYMSDANKPKTLVWASIVRLYKNVLRFALGPLVSGILSN